MKTGASFSPCRKYRYSLWRIWDESLPRCCFIGLNPSTADEVQDDPTIRRCIQFAKDWGYGAYYMLNIFAFRATDPKVMKACAEPIGEKNNWFINDVTAWCDLTVAAWGTHGVHQGRGNEVRKLVKGLHHLGLTKDGHPRHPLYLKKDLRPTLWV